MSESERQGTNITNVNSRIRNQAAGDIHINNIQQAWKLDYDFARRLVKAGEGVKNNGLTEKDLKVERLSGDQLPLDQCYINIITIRKVDKRSQSSAHRSRDGLSNLSLLRRMSTRRPDGRIQIQLHNIFDFVDSTVPESHTKRVVVYGQAGVGKTTFCKKAVHDYVHNLNEPWKKHFDRILWIRLRNLRTSTGELSLPRSPSNILATIGDDRHEPEKTLFLLDGLDEIWFAGGAREFAEFLLEQPNVLVLTRPSISLKSFDLELEIVGFDTYQVHEYIRRMEPIKYTSIKEFLRSRPLVKDLVRIPVLLDALCYTWDENRPQGPETMTDLYRQIEVRLWEKDIKHSGSANAGKFAVTTEDKLVPDEIGDQVAADRHLVEVIAFTGLYSNVVKFHEGHLNQIRQRFKSNWVNEKPIIRTLRGISFLRTSDSSDRKQNTYHFLHLTFQEYFAARYFVRMWKEEKELVCLNIDQNHNTTLQENTSSQSRKAAQPRDFLARHKYSLRYNIMWRFVTGLLHSRSSGSGEEVLQFFQAVNADPVDLLGFAHQRLTMHCLAELNASGPSESLQILRSRLEDHLGEWAIYQAKSLAPVVYLAFEPEFPRRIHYMMLQQNDELAYKVALGALWGWSRSQIPSELADPLADFLQRLHPTEKMMRAGSSSLVIAHSFSDFPPSLDTMDIFLNALGPPRSWNDDVAGAVFQCLSLGKENHKRAVLEAVRNCPQVIAAHTEAISEFVKTGGYFRHLAVDILLDNPSVRLPRKALDCIAHRLCKVDNDEPREPGFRAKILKILTDSSYWIQVLEDLSPVFQEQGAMPQQLAEYGLNLAKRWDKDLELATVAVLAIGHHPWDDENLGRIIRDEIVQYLSHKQAAMTLASLEALVALGQWRDHLQAISACLKQPNDLVQLTAINILGKSSPEVLAGMDNMLCLLVGCLRHDRVHIREAARALLGRQKTLSETVFKDMISRLRRKPETAMTIMNRSEQSQVEFMPPFAEQLLIGRIPYLEPQMDLSDRLVALALFSEQQKLPESVLHAVAECLLDDDYKIQSGAATVLRHHQLSFHVSEHTLRESRKAHKCSRRRIKVLLAIIRRPESQIDLIKEVLVQDTGTDVGLEALRLWIRGSQSNLSQELRDAIATHCETLPSNDSHGRKQVSSMLMGLCIEDAKFALDKRTLVALTEFLTNADESRTRIIVLRLFCHHYPNLPQEVSSTISNSLNLILEDADIEEFFNLVEYGALRNTRLDTFNVAHLFEQLLFHPRYHHLAWYVDNGQVHMETGRGVETAPLANPGLFARAFNIAREAWGLPNVVAPLGGSDVTPSPWCFFGLQW